MKTPMGPRSRSAFAVGLLVGTVLLGVSLPVCGAFSRSDVGTTGAQFLKIGPGARAVGMGEAYSAVVDDASAMYWNPAGLSRIEAHSATFMHASLLGGVNYEFVGYGQKIEEWGYLGGAFQYVSQPAITQTDSSGFSTGNTFSPNDLALSLGYAHFIRAEGRVIDGASVGVAGKYIQSTITKSASAFAADIGFLSRKFDIPWNKKVRAAFVIQHIGGTLKFQTNSDPLPLTFKIGSALSMAPSWDMALDVIAPRDNSPYGAIGTEYHFKPIANMEFAYRTGFNTRALGDVTGFSAVTFGLGVKYRESGIDYALAPMGSLGLAHRISLNISF